MSSAADEDKETPSALPLDLARNQVVTVRPVENTKPIVMTTQTLRSVRVLTGSNASNSGQNMGPTIITNIVPGAVLKPENQGQISQIITSTSQPNQPQSLGNLTIQRPTQITLATPLMAQNPSGGTSYHVPRGPAVVANLSAPRGNIATVRSPIVVTSQHTSGHQAFVRPARTPSPAQNTTWLTTNVTTGNQIKATPTILTTPIRSATIPGGAKIQLAPRTQSSQTIPIRAGAIIQSNITIAAPGQIQTVKPVTTGVQPSSHNPSVGMTLAPMMPARTQAIIYGTATPSTQGARLTVTTTVPSQVRPVVQNRPIIGSRLSVPVSQIQNQGSRLMSPVRPASITAVRPTSVVTSMQNQILATSNRVTTSAQPTSLAKITAIPNPTTTVNISTSNTIVSNASGLLGSQQRIPNLSTLNLQSLVAVATSHNRMQTVHGPKVITQPAQGPATIHLTSLAPTQLQNTITPVNSTGARTVNVPATIVAHAAQQQHRTPGNIVAPENVPIAAKVYPSGDNQTATIPGGANVYTILNQRPLLASSACPTTANIVPHHTAVSSIQVSKTQAYPLPANNSYFYETTVNSGNSYNNRPIAQPPVQQPLSQPQQISLGQQQGAFASVSQISVSNQHQANNRTLLPVQNNQQLHGIVNTQQLRYTPTVVLEQRGSQPQVTFPGNSAIPHLNSADGHSMLESVQQNIAQNKVISSPRPSILRKRDHEGSPLKAAKNLSAVLQSVPPGPQSPSPTPDSRDNGHSSGGSTTISATSSPGLQELNEDSNLMPPVSVKEEEDHKPPMAEMSPRKKPRKQQLTTGNDIDENHDDMQFISENGALKKENYDSDDRQSEGEPKDGAPEAVQVPTIRKPATASLLNGYRQNWKATHNHFQRYADVKPKDERRPTIMDLSNQNKVHDKVNGWKIHHLTTQMEDLAEQEQSVYNKLTELLKFTEAEEMNKQFEKDFNRVNELIKGNLQRIKIIEDGMLDAKCQIMKVFDHQRHVSDIISRCASKRNFKKREKS